MGISLYGLTPATTYDALIKVGDNGPITGALKVLSDGLGTNLPMEASTTAINFTGTAQVGGVGIANTTQVAAKQDTLVSGTNIKTINGTSVLGSGNIVTPTTPPSGVSGAIQFSNGSAFASDASNLFWDDTNNRLGICTNAPASALNFGVNSYITYNNLSSNSYIGEFGVNNCLGLQITGNNPIRFLTDSVERMRIFGNGNTAFGSTTDLGARLGIKGTGATSATTSFLVQNSAASAAVTVKDDLTTTFNGSLTTAPATNNRTWSQPNANVGLYLWSRANAGTYVGTNTGFYHQFSSGSAFSLNNNTNNILIGSSSPSASVVDSVGLLSTTISQSSAVAIGANTGVANFAGVAIGVNATTTGGNTNYGGIALGANALANNYGFAMGYTVANDGEFVAAGAISFNQIKPITNVYFGSGRILDDPSGTVRTGVGVSYAINGSGANGTNFAGGNLTLAGGKGTGTGTAGNVIFSTSTATTSGTTLQTLSERMRIDGSGNVGIGTTTPTQKLDVNGVSRFRDTLNIDNNKSLAFAYSGGSSGFSISNSSTNQFQINNANYGYNLITIPDSASSTAAVGIGTTSPTAKLHIKGNGATSATTSLLVQNSSALEALKITDDGTSVFKSATGTLGQFNANGDLYFGVNNNAQMQILNSSSVMVARSPSFWFRNDGGPTGQYYANFTGGQFAIGKSTTQAVASALIEMSSTTMGFLPPRMTTTQKNAIATPSSGLVVYDNTTNKLCCYNGSTWNDLF